MNDDDERFVDDGAIVWATGSGKARGRGSAKEVAMVGRLQVEQ